MKINSENMNINLRHIRALQAISREGTFAAAASVLGIVPSALTEVVRQLEASIGAPLFDRAMRPPAITPLGKAFLEESEPLLEGMDRAITRLRQNAGLEQGTLSIGASPSAISELIAPVLATFLEGNPGTRCVLHDDIAESLAELVSTGRLDLAVAGRALRSPDLRQREIIRDPFGLACLAVHPFAAQGAVNLADIRADDLIGLDSSTGTQQLLMRCPEIPAAFHGGRLGAHSTIAQLCMIRAGLGMALLPRNAVALFRDPAIAFVEIADLDLWRTLYLLEPARRTVSGAARAFIALLEERVGLENEMPLRG